MSQEANPEGDPYLYGDTSVLRNLAEIRDANRLFMQVIVTYRLICYDTECTCDGTASLTCNDTA
jgi:hypothetical protein